ncbi:MAG: DUF4255 domain-containing protein [Dehalococcoidia bacterium]|nr:DUF4255 domain-containing protein [Dehalococcoidia bacterium]
MSNALAIAAVTAVLRDLLNNGLIAHDLSAATGLVNVTSRPPDQVAAGETEPAQLNVFMYHARPNPGWRNVALPSHDAGGARVANPPLALDLHYLLTAYGTDDFVQDILLGYAAQLLHEQPVLTRDAIRTALGAPPPVTGSALPPGLQALAAAALADQVELIKITPSSLSVDELSRLWSAFTVPYRPTLAYTASCVLIESTKSTRSALPVQRPLVQAIPFAVPHIDSVGTTAVPPADPRATTTGTLAVRGTDLRGPVTSLRIGDGVVAAPPLAVTPTGLTLPLAAVPGLRAGVQSVQVVHEVPMGDPATPHRGFESNVAAFVLHPVVTPVASGVTPTLENGAPVVVDGVGLLSATVDVGFVPEVGRDQRVTLHLYERGAPATRPARAYSFAAPANNGIASSSVTATANIAFAVTHVVPGDYLVRVQVDGAESPLTQVAGEYAAPAVSIV